LWAMSKMVHRRLEQHRDLPAQLLRRHAAGIDAIDFDPAAVGS